MWLKMTRLRLMFVVRSFPFEPGIISRSPGRPARALSRPSDHRSPEPPSLFAPPRPPPAPPPFPLLPLPSSAHLRIRNITRDPSGNRIAKRRRRGYDHPRAYWLVWAQDVERETDERPAD